MKDKSNIGAKIYFRNDKIKLNNKSFISGKREIGGACMVLVWFDV